MSRHGKRAEGSALLSISVPKEIKDTLIEIAEEDGRSLSNLIRHQLTQVVRREKAKIKKKGTE